ncbi:NAD-dependent epimerase/dehydratase family protein [Algisphaera agarilytica]|uniref:UDP-glucuronate 4-epimerase n=1 Tax=Algisphaera agarilytica TaxID=1385975 RepID=A0A7X0LJW5_9BACT|nr:NAD-dependent epimerase/dehydratase family protein [Algisphaera agarilytica]MBB6429810.1 UDP-glucuronate 4-epimerase [Algisphaera agarilytica]
MKTFLVTGAAGLIGSHLCERLLAAGDRVIALDNFNDYYDVDQKHANVAGFKDHENCTLAEIDIRDEAGVSQLFEQHQPDAVAHLAAMANVRYSIGRTPIYNQVNITGSINLLEAAKAHDCGNFVFASTSSIYGKTPNIPFVEDDACNLPLSAYPASKKAIELMGYTYHNLHQMNFTAVRFFSVYGPRARPDMMPFMITDRIARGETITLFDAGQMKRDWTFVDDIVSGVDAALRKPLGYEVINLGRGEPVLMADFVTMLEELIGKKAILDTPPAPASEPKQTFANIEKAQRLLGYDPQTDVRQGLEKLWAWYQKR